MLKKNNSSFVFFLCLLLQSWSVFAQTNTTYNYEAKELAEKPKPSKEFVMWLKENNTKYGKVPALSNKKTTKVTFLLVITEEGKVENPKIWRGIGQGYDEEAFRIMKENPHLWSVGQKSDNTKVRTQLYYQIDFIKNKNKIVDKDGNELD